MKDFIYLREENYIEYQRLLRNQDYHDVRLDELSGGVSAIHNYHKFDKQIGAFGYRRGDYERIAVDVLRRKGFRITLESERSEEKLKKCDGLLNDITIDIKAIEGDGAWSICTKLNEAAKQRARIVVIVFPSEAHFSQGRVIDGIQKYCSFCKYDDHVNMVIVIVKDEIVAYWIKEATPSAEWLSIVKVLGDRTEDRQLSPLRLQI